MADETQSEHPLIGLLNQFAWIFPLVGVEQIVLSSKWVSGSLCILAGVGIAVYRWKTAPATADVSGASVTAPKESAFMRLVGRYPSAMSIIPIGIMLLGFFAFQGVDAMRRWDDARSVKTWVEQNASGERVFIDASPAKLVDLFQSQTSRDAGEIVGKYIGKWIVDTGSVQDVTAPNQDGAVRVSVISAAPFFRYQSLDVFCAFAKPHADEVAHLSKGDAISLKGRIHRIDGLFVDLEACEWKQPGATEH